LNSKAVDDETEEQLLANHPSMRSFIDPVEFELKRVVGRDIRLNVLRKMARQRHEMVHEQTKSVPQQRSFLIKCRHFEYPKDYQYVHYVEYLANAITMFDADQSNTSLKRYVVRRKQNIQ
jgi:hypothetical protein